MRERASWPRILLGCLAALSLIACDESPTTPENEPPTAVAGGPYSAAVGAEVTLDGSGSSDADGSITTWAWAVADGGPTELSGETVTYACVGAGTFDVALVVTDDDGDKGTDASSVECLPNAAPTADAGGPYTADVGAEVTLDGSGSSDPDGSIASWAWSVADGGPSELSGETAAYICATGGTFDVTLTVTDDDGDTGTDTATLECVPNSGPTADAGGPYTADVGAEVTLDGSGSSDPDGSIASWAWSVADGGPSELSGETAAYICATGGTFDVTLTVTDNDGDTGTDTATLECVPNSGPTADAGGPYTADVGAEANLDGSGSSDPDGSIASWAWSVADGGPTELSGETAAYICATGGTFDVTLTVTDNDGDTGTDTATLECVPNSGPTADAGGPYSADVGAEVTLDGSGSSDPDGSIASWAWSVADGGPTELSGETAAYTCATEGSFDVTLTVTDDDGDTGTDAATLECVPLPDVAVTITDEAGGAVSPEVVEFSSLTYVVRVRNDSSTPATDLSLTVDVDADATDVEASDLVPTGNSWGGTRAELLPGSEWAVTFSMTAESMAGSPHVTLAQVTAAKDAVASNNTAGIDLTVLSSEPVCDPSSTFNVGSIDTAAEMAALRQSGATRYGGSVFLDDTDVTEIDLPCITALGGFIDVRNNADLRRVNLPALVEFPRGAAFLDNPSLQTFSAPLLNTTNVPGVVITGNDALTTVDLNSLDNVNDLHVAGASVRELHLDGLTTAQLVLGPLPSLTTLSLPNLEELYANASSFRDMPALTSLTMPNLEVASQIQFAGELPPTISLPGLVEGAEININQSSGLVDFSAPLLDSLRIRFRAVNNADLQSVLLPSLRTSGELRFQGNPRLQEVDLTGLVDSGALFLFDTNGTAAGVPAYDLELPSLAGPDDFIQILDNGALRSVRLASVTDLSVGNARIHVDGNSGLTEVSAPALVQILPLIFADNPALTTLDFPLLEEASSITLQRNASLTAVTLPALTTVTGSINMSSAGGLRTASFPNLTSLHSLSIVRADNLETLDGFSSVTSGMQGVNIQQNASLTSYDGLRNVGDALTADPIFFDIMINNPLVCVDDAVEFRDHLEGKFPGDMAEFRNAISGPACASPAPEDR